MSEDSVPSEVRETLGSSPVWQESGYLRLRPNWLPLKAATKEAPLEAGIYALGLSRGLQYDKGPSRTIYLGSSTRISKRLKHHSACSHNSLIRQLKATFPDDIVAAWWALPGMPKRWLLAIEGAAIRRFDCALGTVPICNFDFPLLEELEACEELVQIVPCHDLEHAPTLDQFARALGCVCERTTAHASGDPTRDYFSVDFELLDNGSVEVSAEGEFRLARFLSADMLAARRAAEVEDLAEICDEHVAEWSVEKMRDIVGICGLLEPARTKHSTSVRRFEAASREAPNPHTWGEVALVQGRILAGTWFPSERVWVKIVHGKTLLGQAFLEEWGFRGEDKSDLPQVAHERPSYWGRLADEEDRLATTGDIVAPMDPCDEGRRSEMRGLIESRFEKATYRA